ncbi:DNA-binding transcriptional regulator RstA [Klebsiella pneumoniae]|uniref:DNA-binding transcriptional regulator RstA n=1 Tax=Klebsiella pneumoniae TaxID=573 RepID=A0A2X1SFH2_KLEPN|nr:DNA-binding transcriptional regulator RstA [Klebsiella pneumoniae]
MDVVVEPRGDRAEEVIAREKPDLVLLDIMLPGKDGMDALSRSARAMARADCPADFARQRYEPYPLPGDGRQRLYSENHPPAVLLARLRLHLRQHIAPAGAGSASSTLTPHKTISFGSLTIDPVNRQVLLGGENVALSTADFDLLWELATHAGQIMDRDALLKNLRGVTYDGMDRSVDVAISRLRKKLLDNATEPYRIKTVRNKGYLFAPHAWDN